jgi:hypothetical protein
MIFLKKEKIKDEFKIKTLISNVLAFDEYLIFSSLFLFYKNDKYKDDYILFSK